MQKITRNSDTQRLRNVEIGQGVTIWHFVNAYDCKIGAGSVIGTFVEIQAGVSIGMHCHVSSHSFLCEGVTLDDEVFIGHGVMFINDNRPSGDPSHWESWTLRTTFVGKGSAVGSNATILGGVRIGKNALVGAGAVVTKDVPDGTTVAGVPARRLG